MNSEEIIANGNMLKEIIMCDYLKRDYKLPEPSKPDYVGVFKRDHDYLEGR
jgi:hypothetical protein